MANLSSYPDNIDGYNTLPLVKDGVTEIRAIVPNRLRDAIVKIESELGTNPSGTFATVRSRLDSVTDASSLINAHLIDAVDAHDASAISILDSGDNYVSADVESALGELATILPANLDVIGEDNTDVPNSGIPSFVNQEGTLFVFNTSGSNDIKKTQPVNVTGVSIIEVGDSNGEGTGQLKLTNHSPATIQWKAPGDSFGTSIDISSLSTGDVVTLSSNDTSKKIRIARNSDAFPVASPKTDTFNIFKLNASTGSYSLQSSGIKSSNFITRTSVADTDSSQFQFMIGGIVFPADKGTLVLQRKARGSIQFTAIATLDLKTNFDESKRETGQPVYIPSLTNFDTVLLFDREPARKDYETLNTDANGDPIYSNFDLSATFSTFQIAKYLIPASNSTLAGGSLEAVSDTTLSESDDKVSTYRLVHYIDGITDFNGEPSSSDIFSISDSFGNSNDGDNNVRMSNVFVDDDTTRPNIDALVLRPVSNQENITKIISGIHYYNDRTDVFDVELRSDNQLFRKAYLSNDILRFDTDVFSFPTGDGYGTSVDVTELLDDGYVAYSNSNLPDFTDSTKDHGFYLINSAINDSRRLFPDNNMFSAHAHISANLFDPFGSGDRNDAYGLDTSELRILVNSFDTNRSTNTKEWFTDEAFRIGTAETFDFNLDFDQFTGAGSQGVLDDWDSTAILSPGELQCGGRFADNEFVFPGLIFPQNDYSASNIRPNQQGSTDYSAASFDVDSIYQRLFNLDFASNRVKLRVKSSGSDLVSFNDISSNNANRPIKIFLKIPGPEGTGFLDVGKLAETGMTSDDDGALINVIGSAGDFTVECSFGTKNNATTSNFIAMRIVYLSSQLPSVESKIISSVELLSAE